MLTHERLKEDCIMLSSPGLAESAGHIVGRSPQTRLLREQVSRLALCDVNLLLHGESGVGKELIARTVHQLSPRSRGPFVGVNCAAIHESLLESELFGHIAGAYTGAEKATLGFLRAAEGGTILLDEVGDMSSQLQSKLLRVLEERAVVPVGGTEALPLNVRVIAATHRDLAAAVKDGSFRLDLYYRLNVVTIDIPPLRERPDDIPPLVEAMLEDMADVLCMPVRTIDQDALTLMMSYDWPGNVRELANVVQRAYALGRGPTVTVEDLPDAIACQGDLGEGEVAGGTGFPSLKQATRDHVRRALQASDGVRSQAAKLLDIDRKSLWRMIRRYDLD
jgi:transcriptional regulator with PAS, ATPase and Fis domain